jgi:hypothetical protein
MSDLEECNRLCRLVHGHDRSGELRDAIEQGAAGADTITGSQGLDRRALHCGYRLAGVEPELRVKR